MISLVNSALYFKRKYFDDNGFQKFISGLKLCRVEFKIPYCNNKIRRRNVRNMAVGKNSYLSRVSFLDVLTLLKTVTGTVQNPVST